MLNMVEESSKPQDRWFWPRWGSGGDVDLWVMPTQGLVDEVTEERECGFWD